MGWSYQETGRSSTSKVLEEVTTDLAADGWAAVERNWVEVNWFHRA